MFISNLLPIPSPPIPPISLHHLYFLTSYVLLPQRTWFWVRLDCSNQGMKKGETQTHSQKSWDWVGHSLWWRCTRARELSVFTINQWVRRYVYCLQMGREEADRLTQVGGLYRGAVSVYSHPGEGSHGWQFLHTLNLARSQSFVIWHLPFLWAWLGESLAIPMGLRHWGPWHVPAHDSNTHSFRTLSAPHSLS